MANKEALETFGIYNDRGSTVQAGDFENSDFFDRNDLVQVKYEMLRAVQKDGMAVKQAAKIYGFSRQTYYEIKENFQKDGMMGLIPKKPGPKGGYKMTSEVKEFLNGYLEENKSSTIGEMCRALKEQMGVVISEKTISRFLVARKEK